MEPQSQLNIRNMILFFVLAGIILFGWQFFYENPRIEKQRALMEQQQAFVEQEVEQQSRDLSTLNPEALATLREDDAGSDMPRVPIVIADSRSKLPRTVDDRNQPNVLEGSINIAQGRIDSAHLVQYRENIDSDSSVIELLKPSDQSGRFYVDFDWENITPNQGGQPIYVNDLFEQDWQVQGDSLSRDSTVTLVNNIAGATFKRTFEVVDNYMIRVTQTVTNGKNAPLLMAPITRITRDGETQRDQTSFTGPVVANGDKFYERNYEKVRKNADVLGNYESWNGESGWIGMTDKYWMVAAIPQRPDAAAEEISRMRWINALSRPDFVVDTRPKNAIQINPGESFSDTVLLFVGAKEVAILNKYRDEFDIKFFSRGIDFSFIFFITQPFAEFLIWLNSILGNVGWSIIVMTLIVKAILFWPNDRAYRSMERMKLLQPQVQEINERYADDQQAKSQKMMELYRETGVNPLGGCLPIFIQMPVFLALYRVLNVTLETRHAPWILWIQDLSAKDPLSLFNGFGLFGMMGWNVPAIPDEGILSFLTFINIGPLAILMGLSMVIQQRMSPPPTDPTQRQIFALMPIVFTFVMANFSAGLVLYWTANNLLTIIQQLIIKRSIANDQSLKMANSESRQKKRFDEQKKRKN